MPVSLRVVMHMIVNAKKMMENTTRQQQSQSNTNQQPLLINLWFCGRTGRTHNNPLANT
jgi:hypothetical protein